MVLTMSAVLLMCGVLALTEGSRFADLMITTPASPYSQGETVAGSAPPLPCWCGPNTDCLQDDNGAKRCTCSPGYVGVPPKCQPGPELWTLCFENNPCGPHSECEVVNGTRRCPNCVLPYEGSPPDCRPMPACRDVKAVCGHNAACNALNSPPCKCLPGYVGDPPNCMPGPTLNALCFPCGAYAVCRMLNGGPVCSCPRGYAGAPPNCMPGPELWRVCFKDTPCGEHSKCDMVDRVAICSPCEEGSKGEPPYCYT